MKKLIILSLVAIFSLNLSAQGIFFETNEDLNVALEKAKSENKLVFIDAFAEWCGPCKVMARDIFPLPEVGEFFNDNFVNLKLDMEKPNNIYVAKKYEVRAYPTYLFLNADGELIHKGLGSMPADKFIEVAKTATDSENNYSALLKKIDNGDRSYKTVEKFISQNPYGERVDELINEYFSALSDEQALTEDNWNLFNDYANDYESATFKRFIENRALISNYIGTDKVNGKIANVMSQVYYRNPEKEAELRKIDTVLFDEVKDQVDFRRDYSLFFRNKESKEAYDKFSKTITRLGAKESKPEVLNLYAKLALENYKTFNDKSLLANALSWAEKSYQSDKTSIDNLTTYTNILKELGNKKLAIKTVKKALKLSKKSKSVDSVESLTTLLESFK